MTGFPTRACGKTASRENPPSSHLRGRPAARCELSFPVSLVSSDTSIRHVACRGASFHEQRRVHRLGKWIDVIVGLSAFARDAPSELRPSIPSDRWREVAEVGKALATD